MKKCILVCGVVVQLVNPHSGVAVYCQANACNSGVINVNAAISNCESPQESCYGNYRVYTCNKCNSGYQIKQVSNLEVPGCQNRVDYNICQQLCNTATNCVSSAWAANGTGYQRRTVRSCADSTTCSAKTEYRCAVGYWGVSINGTSGCTSCGNGPYTTKSAGATSITSCYIPSGTELGDMTGTYKYTGDCFYKNN